MPRFIIAPDSFKGTLTAAEVCDIVAQAFAAVFPTAEMVKLPVADGGEGLSAALHRVLGGRRVTATVSGVFGEPMDAEYTVLPDDTAVIDMAACAGLPLAGDRKNPSLATTRGVGELLLHAAGEGNCRVILGLGGSATNDCGIGMAAALGYRFIDKQGNALQPVGAFMKHIDRILVPDTLPALTVTAACDVDNPLYGPRGAAHVFAPQKGADAAMVEQLDEGLRHVAEVIRRDLGRDVSTMPGAGAAGGLGAAVVAFLNGTLKSGIDLMLDAADFESLLVNTDCVITGEGRMDAQSIRGKVPAGVARRATAKGVKVIAVNGSFGNGAEQMRQVGISAIYAATEDGRDMDVIRKTCREDLYAAAHIAARELAQTTAR
jgi:glycerate kinase